MAAVNFERSGVGDRAMTPFRRKKRCLIVCPSILSAHVLTCTVWERGRYLLSDIVYAVGLIPDYFILLTVVMSEMHGVYLFM